jgi:hypothetical protein
MPAKKIVCCSGRSTRITECMRCGRSRYVKVVNEDGASITTKVAVKQLCYMPITLRLKRLYLSIETAK